MRELSLEEIHQVTLEMMDEIHRICEAHQITYFLAFGTLIGAIRHSGFIPWDDDFDILMPRKEYERFREVFRQAGHPFYRLCERKNTPNYIYGIPRFSDTRYTYVTTSRYMEQFDNGIFIDIYPLDNYGNTYDDAKRIKKKVVRLNMMYDMYINAVNQQGGIRSFVQHICHRLLRIRYRDRLPERMDDMVYDIVRKNTTDMDSQVGDVVWDAYISPYPRAWFEERILHDFDGRQYWIPKAYDAFLRQDYGDYMQLPPEAERHPQHEYKIYRKDE